MAQWLKRISATLLLVLVWAVVTLGLSVHVVMGGKSRAAKELLTVTMMETSAAKFVPQLYFSQAEIQEILKNNALMAVETVSQGTQVTVQNSGQSEVRVESVSGSTFKGKMLLVSDPSRVCVATPPQLGKEHSGMRVEEMAKRDGAVAAVNAGGFEDEGGVGNGGVPLGFVIANGKLVYEQSAAKLATVGFDAQNRLVVGSMTAAQALERGLRDAVVFHPVGPLIVDGQAVEIYGTGGGLNPRTAIGQRSDGTVLILVVEGRQAHSLGASFKDIIEVMQDYGAVNAANLDGGSSSLMVYNNEIITVSASLYGSRQLPTAILVK